MHTDIIIYIRVRMWLITERNNEIEYSVIDFNISGYKTIYSQFDINISVLSLVDFIYFTSTRNFMHWDHKHYQLIIISATPWKTGSLFSRRREIQFMRCY